MILTNTTWNLIVKNKYLNIILTVVAVNLTIQTFYFLNQRFIKDAIANPSSVQKIAICDAMGIKCADISSLVRGSLLIKEGP
tara:strand:+ start:1129 stop:1374 length:246 start_codon:yes stop_codon:yes gene_type:complete